MSPFPVAGADLDRADVNVVMTLGPGIVNLSSLFQVNFHILAGQTWNFQGWYRDPNGPCGTQFNLTNGLAITFR